MPLFIPGTSVSFLRFSTEADSVGEAPSSPDVEFARSGELGTVEGRELGFERWWAGTLDSVTVAVTGARREHLRALPLARSTKLILPRLGGRDDAGVSRLSRPTLEVLRLPGTEDR